MVSKSTYPNLYSTIGNSFGENTTSFGVPNIPGEYLVQLVSNIYLFINGEWAYTSSGYNFSSYIMTIWQTKGDTTGIGLFIPPTLRSGYLKVLITNTTGPTELGMNKSGAVISNENGTTGHRFSGGAVNYSSLPYEGSNKVYNRQLSGSSDEAWFGIRFNTGSFSIIIIITINSVNYTYTGIDGYSGAAGYDREHRKELSYGRFVACPINSYIKC